MREELKKINNVRARFRGTFVRFGERTSHGHPKPMLLLQNIRDRYDRVLTDHVWFDRGKWVESLNLQPGDEIEFDARVRSYRKGYIEKRMDYKLNHPTKVRKVKGLPEPVFDDRPIGPMPRVQECLF